MGGPAKVAALLGYQREGGLQRVQNWKFRGIPALVKVQHPQLFMGDAMAAANDESHAAAVQGGA